MSLPLLGNDFLSSPNARGAITGKTADILADSGRQLSDKIEMMSTAAEAKALAPGITDLYSTAYQKIAAGDFTGFSDMQKARSMAIGNPILMKTMDEADNFAGTLAGQYTHQQLMKMQMDKTEMIEKNRDARLETRMREDEAKRNELAARSTYSADLSAWEKENMEAQTAYHRELSAAQNRQNAENTMAQMEGRAPQQIPMPEKPQIRPRPSLDDHLQRFGVNTPGAPLPSQDVLGPAPDLVPSASSIPFQPTSSSGPTSEPVTTQQAKAAAGAQPINAPLPTDGGNNSQNIDLMSQDQPTTTQPLVNQNSPQLPKAGTEVPHGAPVIRFGTLDISVPRNKPELTGVSMDEKTGDLKRNYTMTKDDEKFLEAIGKVPASVANFASEAHRSGEDVEFRPATPEQAAQVADKKGPHFVLRSSGGVILTERDLDNEGNVKRDAAGKALPDRPVIFDAATEKAWTEAKGLMTSSGLKITMPQITDPQQKASMRNFVIADLAGNPDKLPKLNSANNQLKSWGIDPITSDDIQQHLSAAQEQAKSEKDAKVKASKDAQITAQLQDRGILDKPATTVQAGPRANWTPQEYQERIASNEERLKTLANLKQSGGLTEKQIAEAKMLQDEINLYKSEMPAIQRKQAATTLSAGALSPVFGFF